MNAAPKARYVVNDQGEASAVLLDIEEYRRLLEDLEELESIRAYDAAVKSGDEAIPFEEAIREIEQRNRSCLSDRPARTFRRPHGISLYSGDPGSRRRS